MLKYVKQKEKSKKMKCMFCMRNYEKAIHRKMNPLEQTLRCKQKCRSAEDIEAGNCKLWRNRRFQKLQKKTDEEIRIIVEEVFKEYSEFADTLTNELIEYSDSQLSKLTHQKEKNRHKDINVFIKKVNETIIKTGKPQLIQSNNIKWIVKKVWSLKAKKIDMLIDTIFKNNESTVEDAIYNYKDEREKACTVLIKKVAELVENKINVNDLEYRLTLKLKKRKEQNKELGYVSQQKKKLMENDLFLDDVI